MIEKESDESFQIPLHVPVQCIDVYSEPEEVSPFVKWVRKNLGFTKFGMKHSREWVATYANAEVTTNNCNVVSLGGITRGNTNGLVADESKQKKEKTGFSYTNTTILNIIKVTIGFLPAFLTFMLTQNWWVARLVRSSDLVQHYRHPQYYSGGYCWGRLPEGRAHRLEILD